MPVGCNQREGISCRAGGNRRPELTGRLQHDNYEAINTPPRLPCAPADRGLSLSSELILSN